MRAALFRGVYAGVRAYEKNLSRFFQLLFGKIFFARRGNFVRKGGSEREGVVRYRTGFRASCIK
jgi:hypothetical protein